MTYEVDAKIVDMAILAIPETNQNGFKIVAQFTLLCRPLRIEGCKLAISPRGRFLLWTPDKAIRLMSWAKDDLAETARLAYVAGQQRIAV
ncbi:hypothetical protein [Sulfitobacter sp.]|uniref:hypothetical protein n=1 Tax=Sulfitobacter sp. TaxID=1903071 RepID=UPI004059150B